MATYINLDNLARYDMKAKARAEGLYADASAACWQKTSKAGAVTCVPAPETPLEPVVEFLFKETLPEGTKGPSNPSAFAGVSSVFIRRTDINFLTVPYKRFKIEQANVWVSNGLTYTLNTDNTITVSGTATATSYFALFAESGANECMPSGTYTIKATGNSGINLVCYAKNDTILKSATTSDVSFTLDETTTGRFYYRIASGTVLSNYVLTPQVFYTGVSEDGFSSAPDFSITLSLPSTYYGGTLDVASGRLTVSHRMVEPSSGTVDISDRPALLPLEYTDTYGRTVTSADGTSLDCGTSGGQIVYRLASPYTVQIDPTPIDSLPALDKTSPRINTVYTDAENVQVGYAEHPAYTEELINNAILALGGNV